MRIPGCHRASLICLCSSVLAAPNVSSFAGDPSVPTITPVDLLRQVSYQITAGDEPLLINFATSDPGPFDEMLQQDIFGDGGSADVLTQQDTVVSEFTLGGEGMVVVNASGDDGFADGSSLFSLDFTLAEGAVYQLSGTAMASVASGGGNATTSILLTGTDAEGDNVLHLFIIDEDDMEEEIFEIGTLAAGVKHTLNISSNADVLGFAGTSAMASFDIEFHVGDADGDGLLDIWEEEQGIDVDNDDVVDVELIGADPMRKDLFVEIDAMTGFAPNETLLQQTIDAFMEAPADQVNNPNGQDGVGLHIVVDETNVPAQPFLGFPWPAAEYNMVKFMHYGPRADDSLPLDLQQSIFEARSLTYRYVLFADRNVDDKRLLGIAELPGDDCIVYKGRMVSDYADYLDHLERYTFMHELGHNLGLRHGGTDNINFKPNYFSVMNYLWGVPHPMLDPHRRYEFSRWNLPTLNEQSLNEVDGIGGPILDFQGRMTAFNTAAANEDRVLMLVPTDEFSSCNWNGDDDSADTDVMRNINNWTPGSLCAPPNPDDEMLVSPADWPNVHYGLFGDEHFDTFNVPDPKSFPEEITVDDLDDLIEAKIEGGCVGDINGDGVVAGTDLLVLLNDWGLAKSPANLDGLAPVNGQDLLILLNAWGPCP